MEKLAHSYTSKEVAAIILDTGIFEDYSIDYMKDIDGKFKCRLKQPWHRASSGYTFYPSSSWILFDTKLDAIEDCLINIRSMGNLGSVKFDNYQEEEPKKKTPKKKETPIKNIENIEETLSQDIMEVGKDFQIASDEDLENHLKDVENN